MSGVWPVVADVVVPSAAVLVSSGVAVWLARAERKAAAVARAEERDLVEKARQRERVESALESLLGSLAWFVSADPAREDWATSIRGLRGQVYRVQALHDPASRSLGEWLAPEVERGVRTANGCLEKLKPDAVWSLESERAAMMRADIMTPFRRWVKSTMDFLVLWLRGDATIEEIRDWADAAAEAEWLFPDDTGGAQG